MSVVVIYSPDEFGRAALAAAVAEAVRRSEKLIVLNPTKGDAYVDTKFADAEDLNHLQEQINGLGFEAEVRADVVPDVAQAVLDTADQENASLIVIGIRPRTPVGKLLMGSVAQRLILGATCPVLSVKPDPGDHPR
jgi:nucleotide-binding universal stress UspA family protein